MLLSRNGKTINFFKKIENHSEADPGPMRDLPLPLSVKNSDTWHYLAQARRFAGSW